jgi:hypothetical protein
MSKSQLTEFVAPVVQGQIMFMNPFTGELDP